MTNKLLAFGGIAILVVGLALLIMPTGHIPLLDANRQVLAESEAEGYCAGEVYLSTRGRGDEVAMQDCVEESNLSTEYEHTKVQGAFCRAIVNQGVPINVTECKEIITGRQFWPTAIGGLTNSWNRRFPYPLSDLGTSQAPGYGDESRTGDRDNSDREEFAR